VASCPAYVSLAEALAYSRLQGARLLSEAEYAAACQHADTQAMAEGGGGGTQVSCGRLLGLREGGWEWTASLLEPFEGGQHSCCATNSAKPGACKASAKAHAHPPCGPCVSLGALASQCYFQCQEAPDVSASHGSQPPSLTMASRPCAALVQCMEAEVPSVALRRLPS